MRTTYIGLGANLPSPVGPPEATLASAAKRLAGLGHVSARSSLYSMAPVGYADQPHFINAVIALVTYLSPRALLNALLAIEREFGRDRTSAIRNGPRTLDLDILLIEGVAVSEPGLEVPHPRLAERGFALIPLHEIAPQAADPRSGTTVAQWIQRLLPQPTDTPQNVAIIQSDFWRSGAGGSSSSSDGPVGAC